MPVDKHEKSSHRKEPYSGRPLTREKTWSDNLKEMAPSKNTQLRNEQLVADENKPVGSSIDISLRRRRNVLSVAEFQNIDIHSDQRGLFIFGNGQTICVQVTDFAGLPEDTLDVPSRFMVDKDIVALSWLELAARSFTNVGKSERKSTCQYEITASHTKVSAHPRVNAWSRMAPLRILSFDIETMVPDDGSFPDPNSELDSVIQIATMVITLGFDNFLTPPTRIIYTVGQCNQRDLNAKHKVFENEHDLIQAWFDLVAELDADILTGYNILNFDIRFLMCRMNRSAKMKDLPGRMPSLATPVCGYKSRAPDTPKQPPLPPPPPVVGRPVLDMMTYMWFTNRFDRFKVNGIPPPLISKLENVSKNFLDINKEDIPPSQISAHQRESDESRTMLALYCLKDTLIPLGLIGLFKPFLPESPRMSQYRPLHLLFLANGMLRVDRYTKSQFRRPM
ncbi:ribonuclease H-like protein [Hymenopellis radicata]|nr:ribonuclease H-like protein [Hymenopellis radicata]